jgi:hypothetical protein
MNMEEFEREMIKINFALGDFTPNGGFFYLQVRTYDEMLRHGREYDTKTNRGFMVTPVLTVLHKQVNLVNKQVTYMFQKNDSTIVKLTTAL